MTLWEEPTMLSQSLFCARLFENVYKVEKLKSGALFEFLKKKANMSEWL